MTSPSPQLSGSLVADTSAGAYCARSTDGMEDVEELWDLLAQKDSDLRHAAELGKMLLDEKEADAEAHDAEKEALWRRIQEMARRVVELEQEAAQSHDNSDADDETDSFMMPGRGSPDPLHRRRSSMYPGRAGRMSIGGGGFAGGEGPGERALRAKNEMLERQLAHMKEEAEETQLELAAAKKASFGRPSPRPCRDGSSRDSLSQCINSRGFRRDTVGLVDERATSRSTLSPTASVSSLRLLGDATNGEDYGRGRVSASTASIHSPRPRRSSSRVSTSSQVSSFKGRLREWLGSPSAGGRGRDVGDDEDDDGDGNDDAQSEASEEALRAADMIHDSESWQDGGHENEHSVSCAKDEVEEELEEGEEGEGRGDAGQIGEEEAEWLLEQNAWLLEQLESKDELIEALREQLRQQQKLKTSQGPQLQASPGSEQEPDEVEGGNDSDDNDDDDDDDDDDDNDFPSFGVRERSFFDDLLDGSGDVQVSDHLSARRSLSIARSSMASTGGRGAMMDNDHAERTGPLSPRRATPRRGTPMRGSPMGGTPRSDGRALSGALTHEAFSSFEKTEGADVAEGEKAQTEDDSATLNDVYLPTNDIIAAQNDKNKSDDSSSSVEACASPLPLRRATHSKTPPPTLTSPEMSSSEDAAVILREDTAPVCVEEEAILATTSASESDDGRDGDTVDKRGGSYNAATAVAEADNAPAVEESVTDTVTGITPQIATAVPGNDVGVAFIPTSDSEVAMSNTAMKRLNAAATYAAKVKKEAEQKAAAASASASAVGAMGEADGPVQSRAERKSRQAMHKLGLRTVEGVFRMTMKTSNGVVFIVKSPDVFKHPQQDTYVIFGTAETDRSGSEVLHARNTVHAKGGAKAAATLARANSTKAAMASRDADKMPPAWSTTTTAATQSVARPDPSFVESEAVSAGVDPADVLTILSHVGCSTQAAIAALLGADGDVVNAIMDLTDVAA